MDHVAIMRKSWNLTHKILTGEKTIESRWYFNKYPPWDNIKPGETVYFKDSGEPVTIKARASKVLQFPNLTPQKVRKILDDYGGADGIAIENVSKFFQQFKYKRYCILIFLKNAEKIKPFFIDKRGFGMMSAWLTVENINHIKK